VIVQRDEIAHDRVIESSTMRLRCFLVVSSMLACSADDGDGADTAADESSGSPSSGEDSATTSPLDTSGGSSGLVLTVSTAGQTAGASAIAGTMQDIQPAPGDPWFELDDLPPQMFMATAADGGATANAEFEIARDDPHAVELRAAVDGSANGTGATSLSTVGFAALEVCATDEAAVAFRFTISCSGTPMWNGNAGSASMQLQREMLTHCRAISNVVVEVPLEFPDGTEFEVEATNGEACESFAPMFMAGGGGETIPDAPDDMGMGSIEGDIVISVASVY
jgi:hypothetical protein